jgi:hypothetical protein
MEIEIFSLLILTLILITELFDIGLIAGTAEFSDDFFGDVSTDILAVF